jgi:hypothetical protein
MSYENPDGTFTFSRLAVEATDQQIYDLAQDINQVQADPVKRIRVTTSYAVL